MKDDPKTTFCCPMCAQPTVERPLSADTARSRSKIALITHSLYYYRACYACSIIFRISRFDAALVRLLPQRSALRSYYPWSYTGAEPRPLKNFPAESEIHSNVRPPTARMRSLNRNEATVTVAPEKPAEPLFSLRLSNKTFGVHVNVQFNGGPGWSAIGRSLAVVGRCAGKIAIETGRLVAQHLDQHQSMTKELPAPKNLPEQKPATPPPPAVKQEKKIIEHDDVVIPPTDLQH